MKIRYLIGTACSNEYYTGKAIGSYENAIQYKTERDALTEISLFYSTRLWIGLFFTIVKVYISADSQYLKEPVRTINQKD